MAKAKTATTKRTATIPATKKAVATPVEETVTFADAAAFHRWLSRHHGTATGAWLRLAKKGAGETSITYAEALDVALAWGWIDGVKGALDETWWRQRFSPRGARSIWSTINRDKASALVASGAMQAPGLAAIERAKADGRWEAAYAGQKTAEVPADLAAALAGNPKAKAFFATLKGANRYAILFRIQTVKKAETRAKKIETFVAMLARGETLHG